ncbi:MAG: hypothetical protein P1V97_14520, partial [Planctomycetota bacterium]|nr:hypothetical protein [Planctomycetota bacterium]
TEKEPGPRFAVQEALTALLPLKERILFLCECLKLKDGRFVIQAAKTLGALGPKAKSATDALAEASLFDDKKVAAAAEQALEQVLESEEPEKTPETVNPKTKPGKAPKKAEKTPGEKSKPGQ